MPAHTIRVFLKACSTCRHAHRPLLTAHALLLPDQAALGAWVPLCESVASWRMIQDEGLRNELGVIMQAFKANLVRAVPSFRPMLHPLSCAVKLLASCACSPCTCAQSQTSSMLPIRPCMRPAG
jgi:hypothetical protein